MSKNVDRILETIDGVLDPEPTCKPCHGLRIVQGLDGQKRQCPNCHEPAPDGSGLRYVGPRPRNPEGQTP